MESLLICWWWLMAFLSVSLVVSVLVLAKSDCDLILAWYSRWGKNPDKVLNGKVIWITGASSGIGENLSYVLAKTGAQLILSARREEELNRVLERCKDLSPENSKGKHIILPMDLKDTNRHAALVEEVLEHFDKIDILVNNAGRSQRAEAIFTELDVDRSMMELNFIGTLSLTKVVLPKMIEHREGCVVVISSVAGKIGAPGAASYSASKHALQGYFDTLRMEVADKGISILSVCPGPVDTPFVNNVFREKMSTSAQGGQPIHAAGDRVSVERCGKLIAVAMANQLDEVWISNQPILMFVYVTQYFPNFSKWLGKRIGRKRLLAIKKGESEVNGSYFR